MADLNEIAKKAMDALAGMEFATFVVGVSSKDPSEKQKIRMKLEKEIEKKTDAKKDNSNPDVQVIVGKGKKPVKLLVSPIFIYGRYQKLKRGISQTKWPCRNCKGNGCTKCDYTGFKYKESVEQIIAEKVMEQSGGTGHSLHGAGREDRDALMLGSGRPFILEISSPRKRRIYLEKAKQEINKSGKVKVNGLRMASRYEIKPLKESKAKKIYEVLIKAKSPVKKEELEKLKELKGEIRQRTPTRVSHRRADIERIRHLLEIETEYIDETHFKARLKTDAGLYVKELISGDNGRTKPSMSESLGKKLECEQLDVLDLEL